VRYRGGIVGGPVIHYDHFDRAVVLDEDATRRVGQISTHVVDRDDHAYEPLVHLVSYPQTITSIASLRCERAALGSHLRVLISIRCIPARQRSGASARQLAPHHYKSTLAHECQILGHICVVAPIDEGIDVA